MTYFIIPGLIRKESITPELIERIVCRIYEVTIEDLQGPYQGGDVKWARHIAIYLMMKYNNFSSIKAGGRFNRDHATALNSQKRILNLLDSPQRDQWSEKAKRVIALLDPPKKEQVIQQSMLHKYSNEIKPSLVI